MTNYETIKALSLENLAFRLAEWMNCQKCPVKTVCDQNDCDCSVNLERWLKYEWGEIR